MKFYGAYLGATLFLLLLGACGQKVEEYQEPTFSSVSSTKEAIYVFSIHPLHNPKRLHSIFNPLIEYLSQNIEGASFVLEASRNYESYDKKLYSGQPHFSLPNPFQTINSLKYGYRVFGKMGDDENFRGIILVRKDSGIEKISDLRGKTISYPAPTALAATMMPQYYLHTHGLDVVNDVVTAYVGSQESSIMNVFYKDAIAGATWPPPWRALVKERPELEEELVVKWETDHLPNNSLIAREDVPKDIVKRVGELLFGLNEHEEGKIWLNRMELSKFVPASNETYTPVVKFIEKFSTSVRPVQQ